ncbi:MAG TPA: prepilin-type N-terminal cleavage/methylation domain-containing protein [Limnobacter sp.]|uniref:type IV pilin protein n=1 Tax=Limnobacter sp. TaxID=2003368 RepID=UPI002EDAA284
MKLSKGFTLIELMVALGIVAVLSTFAFGGYQDSLRNANFRLTRDVAEKVALVQQQHRQEFGQYASTVQTTGTPSANVLVLSEGVDYQITISQANFRDFTAKVTPSKRNIQGPTQCWTVQVNSQQGYLKFSALNQQQQDTTAECMPNG